ncbi:glyceraldehyde 3-phosphate dehydrogenase NAD-binding domain-containing protein, partial [Psychroserpens sp.]
MINVAINGFGRIGRRVFRLIQDREDIQVVAINDLADAKTLSHLLKYDSIHGVSKHKISSSERTININDRCIPLLNENHPKDIDW